jgi:CCR4-NOT transcriptional regulation complex NOT5 subunit
MTMVEREAGGKFKKGVVANPFGGMPRHKVLALKKLEGLTGKAIARLEKLLEDQNGSVALGAAKEILDRNLGKVKQQVQVDVTSTHVLHLQALEELAARKKQQIIDAQATEIQSNATLYIEGLRGNDVVEAEVIAPDNASGAADPPQGCHPPGAVADAPTPPATHKK